MEIYMVTQVAQEEIHFSQDNGQVILVGINYDTKSKKHACTIEEYAF